MIGPLFFNKKYMNGPVFLDSLCERPHFSDILVYAHIFRSEIFRGCMLILLVLHELTVIFVLQPAKMGTKKKKKKKNQKAVYE